MTEAWDAELERLHERGRMLYETYLRRALYRLEWENRLLTRFCVRHLQMQVRQYREQNLSLAKMNSVLRMSVHASAVTDGSSDSRAHPLSLPRAPPRFPAALSVRRRMRQSGQRSFSGL